MDYNMDFKYHKETELTQEERSERDLVLLNMERDRQERIAEAKPKAPQNMGGDPGKKTRSPYHHCHLN